MNVIRKDFNMLNFLYKSDKEHSRRRLKIGDIYTLKDGGCVYSYITMDKFAKYRHFNLFI